MNISEYSDNHPSKRNKITKENFIDILFENGITIADIKNEIYGNKEIVMKCLESGEYCFDDVLGNLRGDKEVLIQALKFGCGDIELRFVNEKMFEDEEILLAALRWHPSSITLIDPMNPEYKKYDSFFQVE
jgi:hypothetical protein